MSLLHICGSRSPNSIHSFPASAVRPYEMCSSLSRLDDWQRKACDPAYCASGRTNQHFVIWLSRTNQLPAISSQPSGHLRGLLCQHHCSSLKLRNYSTIPGFEKGSCKILPSILAVVRDLCIFFFFRSFSGPATRQLCRLTHNHTSLRDSDLCLRQADLKPHGCTGRRCDNFAEAHC